MITLYSGIPGSGKTYKMVNDLDEAKEKYFIIHNIDGLKEGYLNKDQGFNFIQYVEEMKKDNPDFDVVTFFSKDYQSELTLAIREKYKKNTLIIIDEAQEWFDHNKKQLKMWLSFHRHLNQDIWLVAHKATNIPSIYRSFVEVEYRAKTGSILCIPGFFMYNRIVGGERIGYKFVRKKQAIFDIYKSTHEGFEKKRPSMLIPAILILCVAGVAYFFIIPQRVIGKNIKKGEKIESKNISNSSGQGVQSDSEEKYRFAGKVGNQYLIEDLKSNKIITISEMPGRMMIISAENDFLKLYDVETKKYLMIRSYYSSVPSPDLSLKVSKIK